MTRTRERRSSVFVRYALSYTLVVLLILGGLSIYLFGRTESQVRNGIVEAQVNRLTRIAIQHEGYISSMLNTAEEIGLSPNITPFRYEEEPWKAYELQLQLVPYTSTNPFCDSVYLLFTGDRRLYSSSSSMTLEQFTRLTRFEQTAPERLEELLENSDRLTILPAQKVSSPLVDGSDPRMVAFVLPLGSSPGISKGSMLFLVKENAYRNMFADAIDEELNTYILMDGEVLSAVEDIPLTAEKDLILPEEGSFSRVFSSGGEDWLAVTLSGRSWGMQYTSVMRMSDVNRAVREPISQMLLLLLGLLLLSLLLIFWMSRRHARPIEDISMLLPAQEEPRRDELDRITTGIRQLTSRLDQALPMQRHDFVLRFTKGKFASRQEAIDAAAGVRLDIDRAYFAAILCSVPGSKDRPAEANRQPFGTPERVTAVGVELVAVKATLYLAFADEAEDLFRYAERIRSEGGSDGGGCVTSVSGVHTLFQEAPTAYLEAAAAYDNRFIMGNHRLLSYGDISSNVEDILPRAQAITTGISQALTLNNREMLDDRISELLRFLKNTSMSPFVFRMIYNDVIDTLTRGQAARLVSGRDARDFYDIFSLSSCQSIDDLDELLRRLCDTLMVSGPEALSAPDETEDITQVVRYMEEHFSDPELSMAAIAESFDLSTTRLSLTFKSRMNMTPSEYLTLLRCEHAKGLLETTEKTIRDIGMQVGYYDAGSFIRRFKQVVGMTPLQYRRSCRENENTGEEKE